MSGNEFEKARIFSYADSINYAPQAVVSKQILKKSSGNISLFAFDKDEGLSEHTAPFDALVHVVEGKVEVTLGGKSHLLEGGQCIIMPANQPHALKAIEAFKMVLIMIKQ